MITFHRASLDTRHFSFEAFGGTDDEACDALRAGLIRHATTYRLEPDWWHAFEDDIEVRSVTLGACYRGPEPI